MAVRKKHMLFYTLNKMVEAEGRIESNGRKVYIDKDDILRVEKGGTTGLACDMTEREMESVIDKWREKNPERFSEITG